MRVPRWRAVGGVEDSDNCRGRDVDVLFLFAFFFPSFLRGRARGGAMHGVICAAFLHKYRVCMVAPL